MLSGAFSIGLVSDLLGGRRYLCLFFTVLTGSVVTLLMVNHYSTFVVALVGMLIGGSSLVVQTVQSADIGRTIQGKKSLAPIIGSIDGVWSLVACAGQLTVGYLQGGGWSAVFLCMAGVSGVASLVLAPAAWKELYPK